MNALRFRPATIYRRFGATPNLLKHIVPKPAPRPRAPVASSSFLDGVTESSYYVGKSIILFTMFYCSLNWLHYRKLTKELEDKEKQDKDNKKK